MSELLVDEISAARAAAEQARRASLDVAEISSALTRLRAGLPVEGYAAWYADLAARWGLASSPRSPEAALAAAKAALSHAASSLPELSGRLDALRMQQRAILDREEHSEARAEYDALTKTGSEAAKELNLLTRRVNALRPILALSDRVLSIAEAEGADISRVGPDAAKRALAQLRALREAMSAVASAVGIDLAIEPLPERASAQEIAAIVADYRARGARLSETINAADTLRSERAAEYERITARLRLRFG